jgi:hypothetical protein
LSRRSQPAPDWAPPRRRAATWDDDLRGDLAEGGGERSAADDLLDTFLPQQLEWRRLVYDYPLPALAVAALGGYWLGRTRGSRILGALTAFAAANVTRAANDILGEELFEE